MSLPRYPEYKTSPKGFGEVPRHWLEMPFPQGIRFQEGPGIMASDFQDDGVPLLRVSGAQGRWATLEGCNYLNPVKVDKQWNHFRLKNGDLIISASASMGSICEVGHEAEGAVPYTGLIRLTGKPEIISRDYTRAFIQSTLFSTQIDLLKTGATIQHFGPTHLSRVRLLTPPLTEQLAITRFLDRETAKIDALVEEQWRLIELLKEKRQAVISHAVTKGLDPLAPMKPSGIEWLGDVPEHWQVNKLRFLYRQEKRRNQEDKEVLSVYRDFGVVPKDSRDDNMNKTPEDLGGYQLVNKEDLVVNKMKAWQGSLGISDFEGITSPDYVVFAPCHRESSVFLHLLLRSSTMVSIYRSISNGIRPSQWRLEPDLFLSLPIFLPPLAEQNEIGKLALDRISEYEALTVQAQGAIDLLQERRTARASAHL